MTANASHSSDPKFAVRAYELKFAVRAYGTVLNQCAKFHNFLPRRSMGNGCMSNFDLLVALELRFDWLLCPNGFGCCDQN